MTERKVGELNGRWSILFRGLMALLAFSFPFVIALGTWTTVTMFQMKTDLAVLRLSNEHLAKDLSDVKEDLKELKKKLSEKL